MRLFRSKVLYTRGRACVVAYYIPTYNIYYHSLPSCTPYNNITYYNCIIYKYGVKSKKNSTVSAPTKNCITSSSTLSSRHTRFSTTKRVFYPTDYTERDCASSDERSGFRLLIPAVLHIIIHIGVSKLFSTFAALR